MGSRNTICSEYTLFFWSAQHFLFSLNPSIYSSFSRDSEPDTDALQSISTHWATSEPAFWLRSCSPPLTLSHSSLWLHIIFCLCAFSLILSTLNYTLGSACDSSILKRLFWVVFTTLNCRHVDRIRWWPDLWEYLAYLRGLSCLYLIGH